MTGAKETKRQPETCFKKLHLSLAQKEATWHFLDEDEKKSLAVKFVPDNTAKYTLLAVTNFADWSSCSKKNSLSLIQARTFLMTF